MILREYFIVEGVPLESIVCTDPVSADDPRAGITVGDQKFAVASINAATHAAYAVPPVPLDLRLGEERFTEAEYAEEFGRYVDGDGKPVEPGSEGSLLTYLIQPDAWSPKRNEDLTLSDEYKKSSYWAGPDGWELKEGVKKVERSEYVKARSKYEDQQVKLVEAAKD